MIREIVEFAFDMPQVISANICLISLATALITNEKIEKASAIRELFVHLAI